MGIKKKWLWTVLALLMAVITVKLVLGFAGDISWHDYINMIRQADPLWLGFALLCMFGFIYFEGAAMLCIIRSLGYKRSRAKSILYASADTYFSAITPSATGGQPASAFFMIRDGIPAASVTAILVFNVIMYTLAVLVNGLVSIFLAPQLLLAFSTLSRVLIAIGLLVLLGMALLFYLILKKRSLLPGLSRRLFNFLHRLHLMRHPEKRQEKFLHMVEEYGEAVDMMTGHRHTVIWTFIYNLLQRMSQIGVTFAMYMALGGSLAGGVRAYLIQSMVVLGSNSAPIPGSMGVTDYLMLDGYLNLMSKDEAVRLQLLSRSVSFYLCVLLSGAIVLGAYIFIKIQKRKRAGE